MKQKFFNKKINEIDNIVYKSLWTKSKIKSFLLLKLFNIINIYIFNLKTYKKHFIILLINKLILSS